MVFGVRDRLMLMEMLRVHVQKGSAATLRVVQDLLHELGFEEGELEEINLRQEGSSFKWEGEAEKDVEVGEAVRKVIEGKLRELNDAEELTFSYLPLFERFVSDE